MLGLNIFMVSGRNAKNNANKPRLIIPSSIYENICLPSIITSKTGNIIDFKPEEPVSNINSVGANTTTTLVATRNYMLAGPTITVDSSYTWTVGGSGTLQII